MDSYLDMGRLWAKKHIKIINQGKSPLKKQYGSSRLGPFLYVTNHIMHVVANQCNIMVTIKLTYLKRQDHGFDD